MTAVHKIGQASYRGPSIFKEIMYGLTAGLIAGGLWKRYHWNLQRRNKEFYDMLERGEISVVVEDEQAISFHVYESMFRLDNDQRPTLRSYCFTNVFVYDTTDVGPLKSLGVLLILVAS